MRRCESATLRPYNCPSLVSNCSVIDSAGYIFEPTLAMYPGQRFLFRVMRLRRLFLPESRPSKCSLIRIKLLGASPCIESFESM